MDTEDQEFFESLGLVWSAGRVYWALDSGFGRYLPMWTRMMIVETWASVSCLFLGHQCLGKLEDDVEDWHCYHCGTLCEAK